MRGRWAVWAAIVCGGCNASSSPTAAPDLAGVDLIAPPDLARAACGSGCGEASHSDPSTICVGGTIRSFVDDAPIAATDSVQVTLYDAGPLFVNGFLTPLAQKTTIGPCYSFSGVVPPNDQMLALVVSNPGHLTPSATLLMPAPNQDYELDGYALERTIATAWSVSAPSSQADGFYVQLFFSDPSRAMDNDFSFYELTPVSGVRLIDDTGGVPMALATAQYLGASRIGAVDPTLHATGPTGVAIFPTMGTATFTGCSGAGCPSPSTTRWEVHAGGTTRGLVVFDRLHEL